MPKKHIFKFIFSGLFSVGGQTVPARLWNIRFVFENFLLWPCCYVQLLLLIRKKKKFWQQRLERLAFSFLTDYRSNIFAPDKSLVQGPQMKCWWSVSKQKCYGSEPECSCQLCFHLEKLIRETSVHFLHLTLPSLSKNKAKQLLVSTLILLQKFKNETGRKKKKI